MSGRRRWRAPQVVQTSAMDCGPASLTCVLRGAGIEADLEGLRDVCGVDVDGTSIDRLTELAKVFGVAARQVVIPADHLLSPATSLLPAVVVVELPGGLLHFVVAWRTFGRWVQIMDPAVGRRWVRVARFLASTYDHRMGVSADAWRSYAGTDAFVDPLRHTLGRVGVDPIKANGLIAAALRDPAWEPVARLDAQARHATRTATSFTADVDPPDAAWMVRLATPTDPVTDQDEDDELSLTMAGIVVLTAPGVVDDPPAVPEALAERVLRRSPSPRALLGSLLAVSGSRSHGVAIAALAVVSAATALVVLWLERLVDNTGDTSLDTATVVALVGVVGVLALGSWLGTRGVLSTGRRLDMALRAELSDRVGCLGDQFFRTRPSSDLAERAHSVHRLHELPMSVAEGAVSAAQVAAGMVGLLITAPGLWPLTVLLVCVAVGVPAVFLPSIAEKEHQSRTIAGAMTFTYLDALVGLLPLRAHRGEAGIGYEHDDMLRSWASSQRSLQRGNAAMLALSGVAGTAVAVWLISMLINGDATSATVLTGAFFAFLVVGAGQWVAQSGRRIVLQWASAQRLLGFLSAELETSDNEDGAPTGPASIDLADVVVSDGDNKVLDRVTMAIRPGEHVAVVGPSGAGKSTLTNVLLGWADTDSGHVTVDGEALTPGRASVLRRHAVWVDPESMLWNSTLALNITSDEAVDLTALLETSELVGVAERLGGTDGPVGESGRLLSGGEGQRVRLARALSRPNPRLVILDEAVRGLDRERRQRMLTRLRHRWADTTLIYVTHDLGEAATFDRVIVVDGGTIVADGSPDAMLVEPDNAYAAMVAAQQQLQDALDPAGGWREIHVTATGFTDTPPPGPTTPEQGIPAPAPVVAAPQPVTPQTMPVTVHRKPVFWTVGAVTAIAADMYLFIMGWDGIGSALRGQDGGVWGVLFVAGAVLFGLNVWCVGEAGVAIGQRLRSQLLVGALHGDPDRTRTTGGGVLLGKVLESDAYEQLVLAGGAGALTAIALLVAAIVVAAATQTAAALTTGIFIWAVLLSVLAWRTATARQTWTQERIVCTRLLLERFRGHRTEAIYGPPPHTGPEGLHTYQRLSTKLDGRRAILLGVAAPGWLTLGLAVAVVTAPDSTTLVLSIGVVLLAWRGFGALAIALDDIASATAARTQFTELRHPADQPAPAASGSTSTDVVSLTNVAFNYPATDRRVLDDVTLDVGLHEHVLLTGPSGAGKTTLGSILGGLRQPTNGNRTAQGTVTYVAQFGDNHTFQSSVAFNLLLGAAWPPDNNALDLADELIGQLGLEHVMARMPRGLAQPLGECGWQLSHGERTRLYLARGLIGQPDAIILDETLAGLDPTTHLRILQLVQHRVPTTIVITHR